MYTETSKTELQLWADLMNQFMALNLGQPCAGRTCPVCNNGQIITESRRDNDRWYSAYHHCDHCGHVFDMGKIRNDALLNRDHEERTSLPTPFGDIRVLINGRQVPFYYRTDDRPSYEENSSRTVRIHFIDIDVSSLHPHDKVFCGFENGSLEHYDSDEHATMSECENDELVFGLDAYDPDEWGRCKYHCYDLIEEDRDGYTYELLREPSLFDQRECFESTNITLCAAWAKKSDFKNAAEEISLQLT